MSHLISLDLRVQDTVLFAALARQAGWTVEENATVRFWNGRVVKAMVKATPPGASSWAFVAVGADGAVHYDSDCQRQVNELIQRYVAAVVRRAAQAAGYPVEEQRAADGRMIIRMEVGA
jgi:hypothetical protein